MKLTTCLLPKKKSENSKCNTHIFASLIYKTDQNPFITSASEALGQVQFGSRILPNFIQIQNWFPNFKVNFLPSH